MVAIKATNSTLLFTGSVLLATAPLAGGGSLTPTSNVTSISDNGVTWNFSASVEAGQFWNGDWFVIDPGTNPELTSIAPASSSDADGAMINFVQATDDPKNTTQGWATGNVLTYDAAKNVDPGKTGSNLSLNAGDCVIKATTSGGAVTKWRALTVLDTVPPVNSFQPGLHGSGGRTVQFSEADVDRTQLQSLTPTASMLTPNQYRTNYKTNNVQPLFFNPNEQTRQVVSGAFEGMFPYADDMGLKLGNAILSLHSNATEAEKDPLMIDLLQMGLHALDFVGQITTSTYDRDWIVSTLGESASSVGRGYYSAGGNLGFADHCAFLAAVMINDTTNRALVGSTSPRPGTTWNVETLFEIDSAVDVGRTITADTTNGSFSRTWDFTVDQHGLPHYGIFHGDLVTAGWGGPQKDTANRGGEYLGIFRSSFQPLALGIMLLTDGQTVVDYEDFYNWADCHFDITNYPSNSWSTMTPDNLTSAACNEAWDEWRSSVSRATFQAQPEVPIPPTVVGGSGALTVSQPFAATHGSAITQWDVRYRAETDITVSNETEIFSTVHDADDNTVDWTTTNNITWDGSSEYVITSLTAGSYRVQVRARNANGTAPWSKNNAFATKDTGTAPACAVVT